MTKSQSGEASSCFGLWCRRGRYHHSDNCAAENTPPVIPRQRSPASGGSRQNGWAAAVKKELCDSCDSLSLSVYLPVFRLSPPPLSVTLALSLSPSPSLCPCALTVSSLTAGWREADARVYRGAQAPASTTRLLCSALWREGLGALKAQCFAQSLLCLAPLLSSPLCRRLHSPHYLPSHCLSSLCHSSIEGVISLLNQDEVFLCLQQAVSGDGVSKNPSLLHH